MKKNNLYISNLILLIITLLVSCNLSVVNSTTNVSLILPSDRAISVSDFGSYKITVTGSDFETLTYNVTETSVSMEIPSGNNRTFTIEAYSNSDEPILLYKGSKTANLNPGSNVSLSISLSREVKSLTFNTNGATTGSFPTTSSVVYVEPNSTIVVPHNTGNLLKDYNNFAGWNTKSDGSGTTYIPGESITLTEDLVLYPKWQPFTDETPIKINSSSQRSFINASTNSEKNVFLGLNTKVETVYRLEFSFYVEDDINIEEPIFDDRLYDNFSIDEAIEKDGFIIYSIDYIFHDYDNADLRIVTTDSNTQFVFGFNYYEMPADYIIPSLQE